LLKEVAEAFSDEIRDEALALYGLDKDAVESIETNTDVVYEFHRGDQLFILKLVHSSQSTYDQVCGEIDWVRYLADNGLSVSRPVPSTTGAHTRRIDATNGHFTVVAYEKARGVLVRYEDNEYNSSLYQQCGRFVGRMHALAKEYEPRYPEWRRPLWQELMTKEHFRLDPGDINDKKQCLIEHLQTLPRSRDSFGLTHGDFHAYNFLVYEGDLTVFDFAECNYCWYAYELASILYHVLDLPYEGPNYDRFGQFFTDHFMQAYKEENQLDSAWAEQMNTFLRLREILIYAYLDSNWDWRSKPRFAAWMNACRDRILRERPIADVRFDFG
jgi:Ser/Thr protein kinase RdoA (MazF antagonist)